MASLTTTANAINGRMPAFYALPTTSGTKLPISTSPLNIPLNYGGLFQSASFATSAGASGSLPNIYETVTLSNVSFTAGALPAVGAVITIINPSFGGNFTVLNVAGTSPTATIILASTTNFTNGSQGAGTWTSGANAGAFTGSVITPLDNSPLNNNLLDVGGAGQSWIAIWFTAGGQSFDVGAVYTPSGSTNWIYPMALVQGSPTHAIVKFPADVAPAFAGAGPLTLTRSTRFPVAGDTIICSDSTNSFTFTQSPNDAQWQYWTVSA